MNMYKYAYTLTSIHVRLEYNLYMVRRNFKVEAKVGAIRNLLAAPAVPVNGLTTAGTMVVIMVRVC